MAQRSWNIGRFVGVLAVVFGLYLIGNQRVALWDRDEPRYAECSREMLRTGDWVVPRFLGNYRIDKPPLIYWCQLTSMAALGDTPFAARLPSGLAILLVAIGIGWFVARRADRETAWWAVVIFCTCGLVIACAKMCITDAVLLVWIMLAQGCLFVLWRRHVDAANDVSIARESQPTAVGGSSSVRSKFDLRLPLLLWIALGLGFLTKGPVAVAAPLMTMLVLAAFGVGREWRSGAAWRRELSWWRFTRPEVGLPLFLIIVVPWVALVHHRAPGFLAQLLGQVEKHSGTNMEGHGRPPGYHTLLLVGTFMPWTLLLPTGIGLGIVHRRDPLTRFALAAAIGPWLIVEAMITKLPHYALPIFPPLAVLTALGLVRCLRGEHDDLRRPIFKVAATVWAIAIVGIGAAPWLAAIKFDHLPVAAMTSFTAVGVLYGSLVLTLFLRNRHRAGAIAMAGGMIVSIGVLYAAVFPGLWFFRLSPRLADDLAKIGAVGFDKRVAMIDYKEPSLAFYQGGGTREEDDGYLQSTPPERWPKWVVLTWREYDALPEPIKASFEQTASENGLMYAGNGKIGDVLVLRRRDATAAVK